VETVREKDVVFLRLRAASQDEPCRFEIACRSEDK
jgi:hypothetical protein